MPESGSWIGTAVQAPRVREPVEVLRALDLDAVVERKGRARGACADPAFRPVGSLDEQHALGTATHGAVAVDPEKPAGLVPDGDDETGLEGMPDQKALDDREHGGERMPVAQLPELVGRQFRLGCRAGGIDVQ
ncbi:hypothetical protein KIV56_02870 [Cryobacterium breve]|uniref:Uncharacterized protein n=1 Tax=Cryobacterium breve TaxID=1259258 RepID=A0ABY7ND71_9MICO|nr:hypothetical protein [Cryobacterium breve]WBM80448.1 hypothetical protein KIV56_02870 [Cryobacterium breve]